MRVALILTLAIACSGAQARDWLDMTRDQARERIIQALDRLEAAVPVPDVTCGSPLNLRHCRGQVRPDLTLWLTEAAKGNSEQDIRSFMAGGPGGLYEARAEARSPEAEAMLEDLCPAMILALGTRRTPAAAREMYRSALRRAVNRAGNGLGETTVVGDPTTLIVSVTLRDSVACTISAEDEHRAQPARR